MRSKERNENSRSRGEQRRCPRLEQGAQVSVAAGAAGGSRCGPGTASSKDGEERGVRKRRYCVLCALGEGVDCRNKCS